jgi:hypothetical protein
VIHVLVIIILKQIMTFVNNVYLDAKSAPMIQLALNVKIYFLEIHLIFVWLYVQMDNLMI